MLVKEEYKKKFKRCILEYTNAAGAFDLEEAGEEDPMAAGGAPAPGADPMGGDPMGGGAPAAPGGDPMGGDPMSDGAPAPGGDPMGGAPADGGQAPQGFEPQGVDPNAGLDGMGGTDPNAAAPADPNAAAPADGAASGEEEEVINVDDLTDSQEETEHKVDALSHKFEKLMGALDSIEKRIDSIDTHTNEYLGSLKAEVEKRNPTPMQRLTMRSTKSSPYSMTPNEYMDKYAPENYSDESDNNGADDPQYKITKADIDNFTDYNSIAKEFDGKMGLRDILNF